MISDKLRVVLAIVTLIYFAAIYVLLKGKRLLLKYALIWMSVGVMFGVLIIFPNILQGLATFFGVYADINFLFLAFIGFLMIMLMSLTIIVSRLNEYVKRLTQRLGILEAEIRAKTASDDESHMTE